MTVADLGCGIGNLLPFLSERFAQVVAVDFSARMLRNAQRRCSRPNVSFHQRSMTDLTGFKEKFDVVVSVNSVLSPQLDKIDEMLDGMAQSLRPDGILAGVFPSMESVLYEGLLVIERERERGDSEAKALRRARRILEPNRYDFLLGLFKDGSDCQKFYYSFELRKRLQRAGFKGIQFGKVLYPWDGEETSQAFLNEPKMWDWFVRATVSSPKRGATNAN
jgi:2-polyprenyl-3-methyl-5-hydroxy-6-metoxy-1,4-benzoquinol methylase